MFLHSSMCLVYINREERGRSRRDRQVERSEAVSQKSFAEKCAFLSIFEFGKGLLI